MKSEAAEHLFSKAPVAQALGFLCYQVEEFMAPARKVKIEEQPVRKVKATRAFGVGELVFAPDTAKITTVKPGEKMPDLLEVYLHFPDYNFVSDVGCLGDSFLVCVDQLRQGYFNNCFSNCSPIL